MSNIHKYVLHTVRCAIPLDVMEIPDELYLQCCVFTCVSLRLLCTTFKHSNIAHIIQGGQGSTEAILHPHS